MGKDSAIEWTHHTFNPWWGCSRVSPGCENCYAETFAGRFGVKWGVREARRTFGDKHWAEPLKWNAAAAKAGRRDRVFCASMADVFDEYAPPEEWGRLWRLIESTPSLDWLLLTKRPQRFAGLLGDLASSHPNVWLGVTVEDQRRANERMPLLVAQSAVRRFVSYEPALEEVDLLPWLVGIDWVIVGAESGRGARSFNEDWARSMRDQCTRAGVWFFYKQNVMAGGLKKVSLPVLDGRQWSEVPTKLAQAQASAKREGE